MCHCGLASSKQWFSIKLKHGGRRDSNTKHNLTVASRAIALTPSHDILMIFFQSEQHILGGTVHAACTCALMITTSYVTGFEPGDPGVDEDMRILAHSGRDLAIGVKLARLHRSFEHICPYACPATISPPALAKVLVGGTAHGNASALKTFLTHLLGDPYGH